MWPSLLGMSMGLVDEGTASTDVDAQFEPVRDLALTTGWIPCGDAEGRFRLGDPGRYRAGSCDNDLTGVGVGSV